MNNQQEWEATYSEDCSRHKNKYPSELVVGWVLKNYGKVNLRDRSKLECLDIGCGYGNNLSFLTKEGFNAVGIDFSPSVVEQVKEVGLNAVQANATNLPFENNYFDFIIDRSSIQHNPNEDIERIYSQINRVLKPGGHFFSVFKRSGNNGFKTSLFSEKELELLLTVFSHYSLDYYSLTLNNRQKELSAYLISAIK